MTQIDRTRERERLIEMYRKKAKHYDITSRLYPAPCYPQRAQRLRAVQALGLRAGDSRDRHRLRHRSELRADRRGDRSRGPDRLRGSDRRDARPAEDRIAANRWRNITLVHADAVDFDFPTAVDAILSTYALSQVPECAEVIAHGAGVPLRRRTLGRAGSQGSGQHAWVARAIGTAIVRPFASIDEWIMRRPWEAIRQPCRKNWTISPGPSGRSGRHSSLPGPMLRSPG